MSEATGAPEFVRDKKKKPKKPKRPRPYGLLAKLDRLRGQGRQER